VLVSAQKPLRSLRRASFPPMVCTMRHPPLSVPNAMAVQAAERCPATDLL
jgi:hypothetical protein